MPAGDFDAWLAEMQHALRTQAAVQVPCGDCRGCCHSGHFVPVVAHEQAARAAIPRQLLFQAPGLPPGTRVMGFDADGRCPMLATGNCAIYAVRPDACRRFDCRLLAAAGLMEQGRWAERVNQRVRAWRFSHASTDAERRCRAIAQAARFIRTHAQLFPGGRVPARPMDLAVLALKVHVVWASPPRTDRHARELAADMIDAAHRFDAAGAADASPTRPRTAGDPGTLCE